MIHSLLSIITSKYLEVHDGTNPWEKPVASDVKMKPRLCLQKKTRTVDNMSL